MDDDDLDANTIEKNLESAVSDALWWASFLPDEWKLISWNDRNSATVGHKVNTNIIMILNGEFIKDFKKRWSI